ncbi:hypothetical protein T439DRAFT_328022 [Meredithblackwellia eburnea MCA 4105]
MPNAVARHRDTLEKHSNASQSTKQAEGAVVGGPQPSVEQTGERARRGKFKQRSGEIQQPPQSSRASLRRSSNQQHRTKDSIDIDSMTDLQFEQFLEDRLPAPATQEEPLSASSTESSSYKQSVSSHSIEVQGRPVPAVVPPFAPSPPSPPSPHSSTSKDSQSALPLSTDVNIKVKLETSNSSTASASEVVTASSISVDKHFKRPPEPDYFWNTLTKKLQFYPSSRADYHVNTCEILDLVPGIHFVGHAPPTTDDPDGELDAAFTRAQTCVSGCDFFVRAESKAPLALKQHIVKCSERKAQLRHLGDPLARLFQLQIKAHNSTTAATSNSRSNGSVASGSTSAGQTLRTHHHSVSQSSRITIEKARQRAAAAPSPAKASSFYQRSGPDNRPSDSTPKRGRPKATATHVPNPSRLTPSSVSDVDSCRSSISPASGLGLVQPLPPAPPLSSFLGGLPDPNAAHPSSQALFSNPPSSSTVSHPPTVSPSSQNWFSQDETPFPDPQGYVLSKYDPVFEWQEGESPSLGQFFCTFCHYQVTSRTPLGRTANLAYSHLVLAHLGGCNSMGLAKEGLITLFHNGVDLGTGSLARSNNRSGTAIARLRPVSHKRQLEQLNPDFDDPYQISILSNINLGPSQEKPTTTHSRPVKHLPKTTSSSSRETTSPVRGPSSKAPFGLISSIPRLRSRTQLEFPSKEDSPIPCIHPITFRIPQFGGNSPLTPTSPPKLPPVLPRRIPTPRILLLPDHLKKKKKKKTDLTEEQEKTLLEAPMMKTRGKSRTGAAVVREDSVATEGSKEPEDTDMGEKSIPEGDFSDEDELMMDLEQGVKGSTASEDADGKRREGKLRSTTSKVAGPSSTYDDLEDKRPNLEIIIYNDTTLRPLVTVKLPIGQTQSKMSHNSFVLLPKDISLQELALRPLSTSHVTFSTPGHTRSTHKFFIPACYRGEYSNSGSESTASLEGPSGGGKGDASGVLTVSIGGNRSKVLLEDEASRWDLRLEMLAPSELLEMRMRRKKYRVEENGEKKRMFRWTRIPLRW